MGVMDVMNMNCEEGIYWYHTDTDTDTVGL